ncbi:hypothetical protein [Taibaiella sp. KBW10]|uniref:hypothetical protein n=1 Tax=Taibaiella sp. KBW10 TaxID=2153357 RepID=UPI000F5AC412|nr:hypothetical protein [Taibaiella sp. KBW10]
MSSKYILLLNGLLLGSTYTLSAQQVSDPATNIPAAVTAPAPVSSYPGLYNFASTLKKTMCAPGFPMRPPPYRTIILNTVR